MNELILLTKGNSQAIVSPIGLMGIRDVGHMCHDGAYSMSDKRWIVETVTGKGIHESGCYRWGWLYWFESM